MKNKAYLGLQKIKGFTLIELMITIGVLAIVATMAIPSFMTQIRKNQLYSDMRDMVESAMETRSEAVFRRTNQRMIFTGTDATAFRTWTPAYGQLSNTTSALEYNLLGILVGDTQCIQFEHEEDQALTLAVTFNRNGSVISGKDQLTCN